jgi:uncharacterized membrane protein YhaH (DUF805 family)
MDWMLMPLRRYADFNGRSSRKEFWMFTLGVAILYAIGAALIFAVIDFTGGPNTAFSGLMIVFAVLVLALIIPSLAVQIRRFHDQDKSGWFVLLGLIPYVGGIVVLVFMCLPGTRGTNEYGPDPLGGDNLVETFS